MQRFACRRRGEGAPAGWGRGVGRCIASGGQATEETHGGSPGALGPGDSKAVENFPVSGERVPVPVVRWLGRVKAEAARVNGELGLLDAGRGRAGGRAPATRSAAGEHDDQFPIDVFQTGSGTSTNTNANEVIAALAGEGVHPNDHVNMGQSSNDVFPSAVHLAAVSEVRERAPARDRPPRRRA